MFKNIAAYLGYIPKRLATAGLVAMAALIPIASVAQQAVRLESTMGVLNVTDGQTQYAASANAGYNDVVQVQLWYHNMENEDSGLVAQNLRAEINASEELGQTQTISGTISADNGNTVNSQVTVNLEREDAKLEFIPGSVRWRHNAGTNAAPNYVTETITDQVVTGDGGVVIENAQPCFNFEATITAQFRVVVPATEFEKSVGSIDNPDSGWVQDLTVQPGERLQYLFNYRNVGNDVQHNVVLKDMLPEGVTYVPGSTWLQNPAVPNGVILSDDNIVTGTGVNIGDYAAGSWAYVIIDVVVDDVDAFECGQNTLRNVGQVYSDETGIYEDDATIDLTRVCNEPVYSCDSLTAADLGNRNYRFTTDATAQNGATISQYIYNFGDNTPEQVTDQAVVDHAYQQPGTYNISVRVIFNVGGGQQEDSCTAQVTVPTVPVTPTPTPTPTGSLPKTGPASALAGLFGTGVLGAGLHGWIISRRSLRESYLSE